MFYAKITLSVLLANLIAVASVLKVPKKRPFAKRIKVEFTVDEATKDDYIGIYYYDTGPPYYYDEGPLDTNPFGEDLMYYVYLCGSQERVMCDAVQDGTGTVFFDGLDPSEEYEDQWPLNPRRYKVCHMRQGEDDDGNETGELIQACKKMTVKMNKKKRIKVENKASVEAVKNTYNVDEKITVKFDLAFKSQNSWVGIYDLDPNGDELMWVYTGCNNVLGDQVQTGDESNDCIKKKKKGQVTFDESNTGRSSQEWPLPPGEYYLKLQYYNNSPYDLYKQADFTFSVV